MKKFSPFKILMMIGLGTVYLTGCFPKVEQNSNDLISSVDFESTTSLSSSESSKQNNNSPDLFPKHISDNEVEILNIDADVYISDSIDQSQVFSTSSAKYMKWDSNSIIPELINADVISGTEVIDSITSENSGPEDLLYYNEFEDHSTIVFYTGGISYSSKKYKELDYNFYFDNYEYYLNDMNGIFDKNEIDLIDKTEAKSKSDKVMSILSLDSIAGTPEVYSITSEKVNKIKSSLDLNNIIMKSEFKEYTEDDDAYLIVYPIEYEGIPSSYVNKMGENESLNCCKAIFVYSKSGLIGFELSGFYEDTIDIECNHLVSPMKACETLKDYYDSFISDVPINVSMIKLVVTNRHNLIPGNFMDCTIEPVWLFYGNSLQYNKKGDEIILPYIAYISAVTGEMISIR